MLSAIRRPAAWALAAVTAHAGLLAATGRELGGTTANWSVSSHITCALPSPGQEWVREESAYDNLPYKSVRAQCPPGKTVLGNGYTVRGGGGDVHVYAAEPDGGATTAATEVTVSAANAAGSARIWSVNAFLVCADPLPGQRVVAVTSASNTAGKGALASCGSIGTVLATGSTVAVDGPGTLTPWTITTYAFCVDA